MINDEKKLNSDSCKPVDLSPVEEFFSKASIDEHKDFTRYKFSPDVIKEFLNI